MSARLTLHPTAAAAAQALSAAEGGELLAGDSSRGLFAFALEMASRVRPFELPDAGQRLALAWAAAERAKLDLPVVAAASFAAALSDLHGSGLGTGELRRLQVPELAKALEAHRSLLAERGLCDPAAVPWVAAEGLAQTTADLPEAVEVLPRVAWTEGEMAFLSALAARIPVTVQLPEDPSRPELFALLDPVHQELARAGKVKLARSPVRSPPSSAVETRSYGSPADEARGVGAQVRALLRSGVPSDSISVVSLGPPAPEIARALEAAGVPVSPSGGSLASSLAGQAVLSVLAAADEGVPSERLCELLEGRLLGVRHSLGWARRLREAGSGSHRDGRLFPPLAALLARKGYPQEGFAALEAAVAALSGLPGRAGIEAHARGLWRTIQQLDIESRLAKATLESPAQLPRQLGLFGTEAIPSRGWQAPWVEIAQAEAALALDRVRELLSSLAGLQLAGRTITLAELAALVGHALAGTLAPLVRGLPGGVAIGAAEALAGRTFGHVFLIGLTGDPPPGPENGFLPERLRRQAREICERPAVLPHVGAAFARAHERMSLALAVGLATDSLRASGARSKDGRPVEPSPMLAELSRVAAVGLQSFPLQPWPVDGRLALERNEVCAALPEEPAIEAAEPELTQLHRRLRRQRLSRERAILDRRIDVYAGDLTAADLSPQLASRLAFDADDPLSATTLDALAGCGFRALAERVFRMRPAEEQDEAIDSGRRGSLLHECLEHGFRALQAAGLLPLGGEARRLEEREVFQAAVRSRLGSAEEAGSVGHPVVWSAQRRGIERELMRVLEAEQRGEGLVPVGFEVKIGEDWPAGALVVGDSQVHLGGKIDRIDEGPGGALRVVDYKSGSIYTREKRFFREFAGRDLQLGHYALALKLARPGAAVDAIYFSIREAKASKSLAAACADAGVTLESFLQLQEPPGTASQPRAVADGQASAGGGPNLPILIEAHVRKARAGEFAVQPGDCRFCKFGAACRAGGFREDWE